MPSHALQPLHEQRRAHTGSVVRAGALLGAGLTGLLDSLLLPQIRAAALAAWALALLGIAMLWRAWQVWGEPRPTPRLVGGLLMGAGAYGLLDSIVLHAALSLHRFARAGDAEYFAGALIALALGMRVSTIPNRARRRERARGA